MSLNRSLPDAPVIGKEEGVPTCDASGCAVESIIGWLCNCSKVVLRVADVNRLVFKIAAMLACLNS